jgi:NAD(P)-dependent dehydrogenase (short-subunit alcohol dehydrogenase family)
MSSSVAIVTGASRGLGEAIAHELARSGARVVLSGRTADDLERVRSAIESAGGTVVAQVTDVTDATSVARLFEAAEAAFGRVDVLVNNAGVTKQVPLVDLDEADWDRVFDTNVRGMFLCTREAARRFATAGSGRAVNVASVFGLVGRPGFSAYCASKGAVINFTRSVAAEWARFGAQINAVAPGYFATDINADLRADPPTLAKVLRGIPAYRMGAPEELANLVTYLALQAPDFLTGQTIAIDGGESSI